jgi:alkanesulfonate monooxygenase SsuD/methylene tetrahydromethanopterin reductase-like flavin-dependent oxidoreductase (luciferase family)
MANSLLFGANIDPSVGRQELAFRLAQVADQTALDLITLQDHPYNRNFFDTWTLLTALAMRTERVHVGANVFNLPLRPPAMLAKQAATLDVLTGGRVEVGLGAGAFWQGVVAMGGEERTPGEAYTAFEEALHILRGMWDNADRSFTYQGQFYRVQGARPGPKPAHHIRIWTGANGPRMQKLTGRMADGLILSYSYVPPQRLPEMNENVDAGAEEAGRSPDEIRRAYNLMGVITDGANSPQVEGITGPVQHWIDEILRLYHDYRQDTFLYWPIGGDEVRQIEIWANEVAPAVKEALGTA